MRNRWWYLMMGGLTGMALGLVLGAVASWLLLSHLLNMLQKDYKQTTEVHQGEGSPGFPPPNFAGSGAEAGAFDFEVPLEDTHGEPVSLRAHRGQVIVISLWATWCQPCLREMPLLEKLADHFRATGGWHSWRSRATLPPT
jgi:thiol-disulfide isomerase/thioredoxin